MREFLGQLDAFHFADQDFGSGRHRDASQFGDAGSLLPDDPGVEGSVYQNGLANLFGFGGVEEVAAAVCEFGAHGVIHTVQHDDGLLRGADHAVVEGLGVDDGVDSQNDIGAVIDDGGGVARADTQCRLAGGVRRLDHAGTAGGKNDVRLFHEQVGHVQRGHVNPVDDTCGGAGGNGGIQYQARGGDGGLFGAGVGRDDDGVACLECQQALEDGGGSGVGRGDDGGNHAEWLGDLRHAVSLVLLNDAAGAGVAVGVVDVLGGVVVLDDLVLHDAHAGLLDCQLGERDARLIGGDGGSPENGVHLLLRVTGVECLRLAHAADGCFQRVHAVNNRSFLRFHVNPPCELVFRLRQRVSLRGGLPFGKGGRARAPDSHTARSRPAGRAGGAVRSTTAPGCRGVPGGLQPPARRRSAP